LLSKILINACFRASHDHSQNGILTYRVHKYGINHLQVEEKLEDTKDN